VLGTFGEVVHCGGPGAGQAAKLAFNAVLAVTMTGIGEAVALGERLGLDTSVVLDVLRRGGAGPMVGRKADLIERHAYPASFALSLMRKDVGLVREAGRDAHAWLPLSALAEELYETALRRGLGDGDYSGVTEVFRSS
jgi:3-hydroxyisobutyrate dehydrogenase